MYSLLKWFKYDVQGEVRDICIFFEELSNKGMVKPYQLQKNAKEIDFGNIKEDDKAFYAYKNAAIKIYCDNDEYYRIAENVARIQKWMGIYDKKSEIEKEYGKVNFISKLEEYIKECNITTIPNHSFDKPVLLNVEKASLMANWASDIRFNFPPIIFYNKSIFSLYKKFNRYGMRTLLKFLSKKYSNIKNNKELFWDRYEFPKYYICLLKILEDNDNINNKNIL